MTRDNHLQRNPRRPAWPAARSIVLGLCLLAFVRGAYQLGERSLWWDESLSHYRATQPLGFILSNRMTFVDGDQHIPITPDNHPPLYFVLLKGVTTAAGDSEFALRVLSLASGVLLIPLLYQCGRRLYDAGSGVWAALFGAASPLYLWAQQEARPYALLTALALLSFYALIRVMQPTRSADGGRRQRIGWTAAYLLSTIAMLATHYQGFLLLPAHGVVMVLAPSRRKRKTLAVLAALGVLAVPLLAWAIGAMPQQTDVPGYAFVPLGALLQDVFRSFPLGVSGTASPLLRPIPFHWIGAGALLAALAVLLARGQNRSPSSTFYLLLMLCAPVAAIYVLSFVRPAYMNVRHLIAASPFYTLLLAAGIARALRPGQAPLDRAAVEAGTGGRSLAGHRPPYKAWGPSMPKPRLWAAIPMGLLAGVLLIGMALSTQAYRTSFAKEDHRGWGRYLSEHVRPDDLVLINPGASAQLYFYYVESPARWLGFPPLYADPEGTIHRLQEVTAPYERVWVAQSLTPHWANPDNLTIEWLRENAARFAGAKFYSANTSVRAEGFLVRPPLADAPGQGALPSGAIPLDLAFGERLRLLGIEAGPATAGHTLRLSLYWSPLEPLAQNYRVTLSLKDERGVSWADMDRAPYDGGYPTRDWPAGRLVRHDVDLDVPHGTPPGFYQVYLAVYPEDRSEPALAARETSTGGLQGLVVPVARIEVAAPERPPLAKDLPLAHRTPRRFGDLALLGHDNDPQTVLPGDVAKLDAYWKVMRVPVRDGALALQLADPEGEVLASVPLAPAGDGAGARPRKGEIVRGQYRLRVPLDTPEGVYAVHVAASSARASWPWKGGRVQIGALAVRAPDDARSFEIPPIQHPLRGNLNDQVELLGYDLGDSIRAGQAVSCTLYWRALEAIDVDYTVFTHLTAPDGRTWGQWDNQPQRGSAPTTRWAPGQVIADPYRIPLPEDTPPGRLELRVGMYDRRTMARLPVLDEKGQVSGDHIVLAELEVTGP